MTSRTFLSALAVACSLTGSARAEGLLDGNQLLDLCTRPVITADASHIFWGWWTRHGSRDGGAPESAELRQYLVAPGGALRPRV
jgi:hypothetical protein